MEEDRDKPFVGMYTGLALRRGERKRGLSVVVLLVTESYGNFFVYWFL